MAKARRDNRKMQQAAASAAKLGLPVPNAAEFTDQHADFLIGKLADQEAAADAAKKVAKDAKPTPITRWRVTTAAHIGLSNFLGTLPAGKVLNQSHYEPIDWSTLMSMRDRLGLEAVA